MAIVEQEVADAVLLFRGIKELIYNLSKLLLTVAGRFLARWISCEMFPGRADQRECPSSPARGRYLNKSQQHITVGRVGSQGGKQQRRLAGGANINNNNKNQNYHEQAARIFR